MAFTSDLSLQYLVPKKPITRNWMLPAIELEPQLLIRSTAFGGMAVRIEQPGLQANCKINCQEAGWQRAFFSCDLTVIVQVIVLGGLALGQVPYAIDLTAADVANPWSEVTNRSVFFFHRRMGIKPVQDLAQVM